MTTTGITTHSHDPEATTAPEDAAVQTKRSRFIFAGVLLVASFAAGSALFLAGQGGIYSGFPIWAAVIIGVFNVAIMIYPLAQAHAHKAQFWMRFWVALAAVLMGFFGTPVTFWLGSLIGPGNALNYILGAVAIILNASAAFMLAYITSSERSVVPDLEAQLEVARTGEAARDQEWRNVQNEVDTLTSARDTKKAEWEMLGKSSKDAEKLVKKAKKALDKSPVARELDAANKAHPLAEQALADHIAAITEDKKMAKAGLNKELREMAEARLVDLNKDLPDTELAVQEALNRVKEAKKKFDASPELAAHSTRVEESISANERRDRADRELKDVEKRLNAATNVAGEKADLRKKQSSEVTRLTDKLETARRNDVNIWRDVLAGPVIALVLAFLMYPNWNIWVITTIGARGI